MLTRAGWTVAVLAAVAIVSGRLLGSVELFIVGGVAAMLVVAAGANVVITRIHLHADRTVQPARLHAGDAAIVELSVTNTGHRRSATAMVIDTVDHTRLARVRIAPLAPGRSTTGRYQLLTDHRGRLNLGPLRVHYSDPLGLTRIDLDVGTTDQMVIFPAVDRLPAPPPDARGERDTGNPQHQRWIGGDEFHALRGYATGDDLRHVHWPTSARVDELMVRQSEAHRQTRTTVVLDTRSTVHSAGSFEPCVSAAASVLMAAARRGDLLNLATTTAGADGNDTPAANNTSPGNDHADLTHLLNRLADIDTSPPVGRLDGVSSHHDPAVTVDTSGVVVVVTTSTGVTDVRGLLETSSAARHATGVLVVFADPAHQQIQVPGTWPVVMVTTDNDMATAWTAWATTRRPYLNPQTHATGAWNPVGTR
jgi:uncharacterized protein (DUF58 family)